VRRRTPGSAAGPDVLRLELPFAADQVIWAGLIPHALAGRLRDGVVLQAEDTAAHLTPPAGTGSAGSFRVSEVIPAVSREEEGRAMSMPLDVDLLPQLRAVPFGKEERVTARVEDGRLVVRSKAGTAPAGVTLQGGPWYLPEDVDLKVAVAFSGVGEYEWTVSDKARASREAPLLLGKIEAAGQAAATESSIPRRDLDRTAWACWSLICPPEGGQISLTSVKLVAERPAGSAPGSGHPQGVPPQAPGKSIPSLPHLGTVGAPLVGALEPGAWPKAIWAWRPALWRDTPDLLLERLRKAGATTVYITVPVSELEPTIVHAKELERFIERATAEGVRVWAVVGDPRAVFPGERPRFVRRAEAYAAYNRCVDAPARLAGVQYDIEPYVLPGYQLDPEPWNSAYLETISALKAAAAMPLEAVLPFWYAWQTVQGRPLLDRLAPCVDSVAVMDYRTDPTLVQQFAEPFLSWGVRTGRPVRIALEAGALPDQMRRHYRPAASGELWLSRVGESDVLILLKRPGRNPRGLTFREHHVSRFLASRMTFHENEASLTALIPRLEAQWGAWSSFAGLALHGLEELQ
jgi:hypothetical protein